MSAADEILYETMFRVENKDIFVDLKKNKAGVYLKISERNEARRNTILIPASGISKFRSILDTISSRTKEVSKRHREIISSESCQNSVFVSGLSWGTTEELMSGHFAQVGTVVSSVVLRQRPRSGTALGRSLGCGIVEYSNPQEAANAISLLNGSQLDGRVLKCRADRGNSLSEDAGEEETVEPEEDSLEPNKVFVSQLPYATTGDQLIQMFGQVGRVLRAEHFISSKGKPIGAGMVEFADSAAAAMAVRVLNGQLIADRVIQVKPFRKPAESGM